MRLFIAIELEDAIREYIHQKQRALQSCRIRGNFTRKENLHLTLRFLGEMGPDQIMPIEKALKDTAAAAAPFSMEMEEWGQFPSSRGKILWIGIGKGREPLKALVSELETNLEKQGFEREKKVFQPHITVGREVQLEEDPERITTKAKIEPKEIHVSRISLMESKRINGVLTYIPIYRAELGQKEE